MLSEFDAKQCYEIGADAIQISNHSARQLDYSLTSDLILKNIANKYKSKMTLFVDSGIKQGSDIAVALGLGADATFLGRSYMYGVTALRDKGPYPYPYP